MGNVLILETYGKGQAELPLIQSEIQDVLNSGLTVTHTLIDDVSRSGLILAIRGGDFEVLWVVGHAGADGIPLSDGMLSPSAFTSLVRDQFKLIYINTCESLALAQMIQNESSATVVCTVSKVSDATAYQTGSLFASELARTKNYRVAYNRSKPGENRDYIFLSGSPKNMAQNENENENRGNSNLHQEIGRLSREISNLAQQIYELRAAQNAEITIMKSRQETSDQALASQKLVIEGLAKQLSQANSSSPAVNQNSIRALVGSLLFIAVLLLMLIYTLSSGGFIK